MKKSPYHQADGIASAAGKSLKHKAKKEMLSTATGKSKEQIEYDLSRAERGKEIKKHRENNPREGGTFNADATIASTFPKAMKGGIAAKALAESAPLKQTGMVDPMLTNVHGMPVDPMQAAQPTRSINVGMPGSTPVPAGVAQNLTSSTLVGGKMLSPIAPMAMKGDLDKDGKMSSYEQARQTAIEKNMSPMKQTGIPSAKDVIGNIYPAGRDSTINEKMYVHGEKTGYTPETMKLFQKDIEKEQDNRTNAIINPPQPGGGFNPQAFRDQLNNKK